MSALTISRAVWILVFSIGLGTAALVRDAASQGSPSRPLVSEAQFEAWQTELSNWGRWGKDDQLGTLNLTCYCQDFLYSKRTLALTVARQPLMHGKEVDRQAGEGRRDQKLNSPPQKIANGFTGDAVPRLSTNGPITNWNS